jgi:hypothetical protein
MSNINIGTITGVSTGTITGPSTWTIGTITMWNPMIFKEAHEVGETIEMIYTQTSQYYRTGGMPPYNDERAIKIVYSCINGKWNKSEPIIGKIIPAQEEYFEF